MSRNGYEKKKHPYQLQLRSCSLMDPEGIENSSSTSVDFKEGIITEYQTDGAQVSTLIRKYVATDVEMKELYSFFTLDTIEAQVLRVECRLLLRIHSSS